MVKHNITTQQLISEIAISTRYWATHIQTVWQ